MTKWSEGYVSDHAYGSYYFKQLSPSYLKGVLLRSGFLLSSLKANEPFYYLELGFGQGLSLNIHAAIDQEGDYFGTDFLKEQVLNAQSLSDQGQLGTHLLNFSFEAIRKKSINCPHLT